MCLNCSLTFGEKQLSWWYFVASIQEHPFSNKSTSTFRGPCTTRGPCFPPESPLTSGSRSRAAKTRGLCRCGAAQWRHAAAQSSANHVKGNCFELFDHCGPVGGSDFETKSSDFRTCQFVLRPLGPEQPHEINERLRGS